MSNKTKIICTIGPASNSVDILVSLINSGMDAARLNFSHGNYDSHKEMISNIRAASGKCGIKIPIIMDLQGPKIRVGNLENGSIKLIKDNLIRISGNQVTGKKDVISSTYKNLIDDLKEGDIILLDDGLLKLQVIDITGGEAVCKIIKGGILKEKKGINLPHTNLKLPSLSEKDYSDIEFGIINKIDLLALSFVREPEDVLKLKEHLNNKNYNIPVISKIERPEAINRIDEIINVSDAVMVARGDLGIEISPEDVPVLQKMIIKKCNQNLKPVITATQMLESMVVNLIPTRAEASDVANAILDGTDCVMLSAETSVGSDPVNVVQTMERIILKTEANKKPKFFEITGKEGPLKSLCNSATELASRIDAKVIVTITKTGKSPLYLSSHRVQSKIISASNDDKINKFVHILWGVKPYYLNDYDNLPGIFDEIIKFIISEKSARKGDKIIIIYNKSTDEIESADTISVVEI
jgi:pyruvate kinase